MSRSVNLIRQSLFVHHSLDYKTTINSVNPFQTACQPHTSSIKTTALLCEVICYTCLPWSGYLTPIKHSMLCGFMPCFTSCATLDATGYSEESCTHSYYTSFRSCVFSAGGGATISRLGVLLCAQAYAEDITILSIARSSEHACMS